MIELNPRAAPSWALALALGIGQRRREKGCRDCCEGAADGSRVQRGGKSSLARATSRLIARPVEHSRR